MNHQQTGNDDPRKAIHQSPFDCGFWDRSCSASSPDEVLFKHGSHSIDSIIGDTNGSITVPDTNYYWKTNLSSIYKSIMAHVLSAVEGAQFPFERINYLSYFDFPNPRSHSFPFRNRNSFRRNRSTDIDVSITIIRTHRKTQQQPIEHNSHETIKHTTNQCKMTIILCYYRNRRWRCSHQARPGERFR